MAKENEPIAGLVKDGVIIHLDYAPVPECTMQEFTYGEICIKCNVCGRFKGDPKPTEAEVRSRLGCPLEGMEVEGWGYDNSNGIHHWYDRLSSVAECGWAGRPDEVYSDEYMQNCVGVDFCTDCVKVRKEKG